MGVPHLPQNFPSFWVPQLGQNGIVFRYPPDATTVLNTSTFRKGHHHACRRHERGTIGVLPRSDLAHPWRRCSWSPPPCSAISAAT